MALNIPASSKIPQEWEISLDLNVLLELMNISNEILGEILAENPDIIMSATTQKNCDINENLLYKLYFFANEHWLANWNKETKSQIDVDKVTCTRRLRDACKKEISRRTML